MSQNQATNSSMSIFKWVYIDNVSKQTCSSHDQVIFFSFIKPKNYVFHISFNKTSWCKNIIAYKCTQPIFPYQDISYLDAFSCPSLSCVFAWWSRCSGENLMFFVGNSMPSYSLSFACKNCLGYLAKDLPAINSISCPNKILHLPPPTKTYVP